jgi:2-polyprenyl-3-methyl-5-hydroxy-6-metoxy-1,4-benzoquinol methylase
VETPTIETVRSYWDAQPCNIRHSSAPLGSVEFDREVRGKKFRAEPDLVRFSEFSRLWGGVLDVGCGIGTQSLEFARGGNDVMGIDLSTESLQAARSRLSVHPELSRQITFMQGDAQSDSFCLWSVPPFDLVYCWGVLHHTPNPFRLLANLRAHVRRDGRLKMMVYHRHSWKALAIRLGRDQPEAQSGCPIARTYTRSEIRQMLDTAGFEVVSVEVDHIFPYSIPEYREGRFVKRWYFRWMPQVLFRWLERHCGWHLLIDAKVKA